MENTITASINKRFTLINIDEVDKIMRFFLLFFLGQGSIILVLLFLYLTPVFVVFIYYIALYYSLKLMSFLDLTKFSKGMVSLIGFIFLLLPVIDLFVCDKHVLSNFVPNVNLGWHL